MTGLSFRINIAGISLLDIIANIWTANVYKNLSPNNFSCLILLRLKKTWKGPISAAFSIFMKQTMEQFSNRLLGKILTCYLGSICSRSLSQYFLIKLNFRKWQVVENWQPHFCHSWKRCLDKNNNKDSLLNCECKSLIP